MGKQGKTDTSKKLLNRRADRHTGRQNRRKGDGNTINNRQTDRETDRQDVAVEKMKKNIRRELILNETCRTVRTQRLLYFFQFEVHVVESVEDAFVMRASEGVGVFVHP